MGEVVTPATIRRLTCPRWPCHLETHKVASSTASAGTHAAGAGGRYAQGHPTDFFNAVGQTVDRPAQEKLGMSGADYVASTLLFSPRGFVDGLPQVPDYVPSDGPGRECRGRCSVVLVKAGNARDKTLTFTPRRRTPTACGANGSLPDDMSMDDVEEAIKDQFESRMRDAHRQCQHRANSARCTCVGELKLSYGNVRCEEQTRSDGSIRVVIHFSGRYEGVCQPR